MTGSKSVRNLTQGKIFSQILFFAIPVIIGNLLQELYNVVDTLIVGQTLGEIKLAAVGSTSSLNFFALGFFIGLSAGCSVITSQHFGAGNIKQIKKSVAAHILIGIISSAVLTVAFVFLVNPFLTMLGTTKETFDYASRYLTIIYLGIPATMLYNLTASLLRSGGCRSLLRFYRRASGRSLRKPKRRGRSQASGQKPVANFLAFGRR